MNILYENQQFKEYIGVVEQLLIREWKDFLYGRTDFALGSFGISSHAPPIPLSQQRRTKASSSGKAGGGDRGAGNKYVQQENDNTNFGEALQWQKSGLVTKINRIIQSRDDVEEEEVAIPHRTRQQLVFLWQHLISTAIAMGTLAVEKKQFVNALQILQKAETYALNEEFLSDKSVRRELRAHCCDAMAYYFFKKGKALAALSYAKMALEAYELSQNIDGIATTLLHIAAGYGQLGEHKVAHKVGNYACVIIITNWTIMHVLIEYQLDNYACVN